jgi:hypothetical protein
MEYVHASVLRAKSFHGISLNRRDTHVVIQVSEMGL